jgi:hypothetical protein
MSRLVAMAALISKLHADPAALQTESSLSEIKSQVKMVLRRLNRNSEPQASIESGAYVIQYVSPYSLIRLLNIWRFPTS